MRNILNAIALLIVLTSSMNAQEIVELPLPKSDKVIIKLMFRNGSISDPAGKEGITSLTVNTLMEGGTATLTQQQINDKLYPWAAGYGASVDKEVTIFTFEVPSVFVDDFYPILKGLMLTPSFSQEDFDRVKNNQQNYVDEVIRATSDEEYSKKALEGMLFRGTNYAHLIAGTSSGIKSITLADVKAHYAKVFTRDNVTIGIAGKYSDAFKTKLLADINQLPKLTTTIPTPGKAIQPDGINVEIISKDNALGSAIFAGFPLAITRSDDDFAAMMVANSWLGEHRKSYGRLYTKIREARSMNYGDYSYIEWYERGGSNMLPVAGVPRSSNYASFWIRPVQTAKALKEQYSELKEIKIGHAHFAIRMALREMDYLIKNGMTKKDFELTRDFLKSYMKLYVQSPSSRLGYLMDSQFYGRKDYINEMDALLSKLTVEQVNSAIKKYWQINNVDIVIVTDKSEAEPLAQSLRTNADSPMSYSNSLKAAMTKEILEEDISVSSFPMPVKKVTITDSDTVFRK